MEHIRQFLLFAHILGGGVALLAGPLAIVSNKWGVLHKVSGRSFYYSTLVVALSALLLTAIKPNLFLGTIGMFTFYQIHAAFRSVRDKSLHFTRFDWLVLVLALGNALLMLYTRNLVLMVFGGINLVLVLQDLGIYLQKRRGKKLPANSWLLRHFGMMLGSYIAVFTAFLVVNSAGQWYIWLGPTFVMVPLIVFWNVRIRQGHAPKPQRKKPQLATVLLLLLLAMPLLPQAQVYVEGGNTRHRFAQLNVGVNSRINPAGGERWESANGPATSFGTNSSHRLVIGGTHFWGHADFYVAFPLVKTGNDGYEERIETGFRYLPWRLESGKMRPFIGISHQGNSLVQADGAKVFKHRLPLTAGVNYLRGAHLWELSLVAIPGNRFDYYYHPTQMRQVQAAPIALQLGYKWMFDTTVGFEKNWQSGRTAFLTDTLQKLGRLNGLTVGFGPSAAFFMGSTPAQPANISWLGQHRSSSMLELMLGYYWHQPDLQASLLYRAMHSQIEAFGQSELLERRSVAAEVYHFFADYHGFVPYAGLALSYENWQVSSQGDQVAGTHDGRHQWLAPGISAGWDIRPDRLQRWYLRTSLRYFPYMRLSAPGQPNRRVDQLEVNFIQLVILPGRF